MNVLECDGLGIDSMDPYQQLPFPDRGLPLDDVPAGPMSWKPKKPGYSEDPTRIVPYINHEVLPCINFALLIILLTK